MSASIRARARLFAGVIALTALGAAASQASADELLGPDVVVHYGDLDLNTRSGAETLFARIQKAAVQVCGQPDPFELLMRAAAVRCRSEVVGHAVARVPSSRLAAVYKARLGDHRPV